MGRLILAFAVATLAAVAGLQPTHAHEPLFLRIRPAGVLSDEEVARQARLAREAVWTRSDQRARAAIASICAGCLRSDPAATGAIVTAQPEAAERSVEPAPLPQPISQSPASTGDP